MCVYMCMLYLCILCTRACRCAVMHICGYTRDWYYASNNDFTLFFETASLMGPGTHQLAWQPIQQIPGILHAGSTSTHVTVPGFLPGCLGSGLRCSCFHSKHLTNWAIFPASYLCPPLNRTGVEPGSFICKSSVYHWTPSLSSFCFEMKPLPSCPVWSWTHFVQQASLERVLFLPPATK